MSETVPPPAGPPPPAAAPWYDGQADQVMLGYWQNKGLHDKTPAEIAIAASKAAIAAQQFAGAPPERLIKLPTDVADERGWKDVWQKLGAPADAAGYDFAGLKRKDGSAADPAFVDAARARAAELNLPKEAATRFAQGMLDHMDSTATAAAAESTASLQAEQVALKQNWGSNFDANMLVAREAAAKLGVTPEQVAAIEKSVGYAKVMDMFRQIGVRTGEDRFVSNGTAHNDGVMTVAQAHARRAELMADKDFTKRYLAGDAAAGRQMSSVIQIIASGNV